MAGVWIEDGAKDTARQSVTAEATRLRLRAAMASCSPSHPTRVHIGTCALRTIVTSPSTWRYTRYDCAARTASASAATDSGELPSALLLMMTYAGWPAPTVPAMTRASVARVSGSGSTSLSNGA